MATKVAVLIEQGSKRTFASALDWPGWARAGRTPHDALEVLESYRARYAAVLGAHALDVPTGSLSVTETLEGNVTTDFGAPSVVASADRRALRRADRERLCDVLQAIWSELASTASRTAAVRPGPRGGGRSVDGMVEHVAGAEIAGARKLGLRVPGDQSEAAIAALRERLCGVVRGELDADRVSTWPVRYAVRRLAWHACDHLFEMQDRAITS